MFWKNVPTEGERFRQELYHKWEIQWGIDISTCEQDSEAERLFMDFFKTIYHETEAKSEKNRRMNFVFKGLFILCLFLISASLVVVPCLAIAGKFAIPISNATEEHTVTIADLTFLNAQIFLAGGTLLFAINKIINVKKIPGNMGTSQFCVVQISTCNVLLPARLHSCKKFLIRRHTNTKSRQFS